MRSIRRFVYSAVLALSALTFTRARLTHRRCTAASHCLTRFAGRIMLFPAGDYRFEVRPRGRLPYCCLRKVSGNNAGFLILANKC